MLDIRHASILAALVCVFGLSLRAQAEEVSHGETHHAEHASQEHSEHGVEWPFRLLRLKEAYIAERGEWQFRLQTEYLESTEEESEATAHGLEKTRADLRDVLSTLSIEYSITDRLKSIVSLPVLLYRNTKGRTREFEHGTPASSHSFDFDDSSFGDIDLALALGLLEEQVEDPSSLVPALTVELGLSVPTGDEPDHFGAGMVVGHGGLLLTKSFGSLFATANLEFGAAKGLRKYEYGVGLLYMLGTSGWSAGVELEGATEHELDENEYERALHVIPSVSYGWADSHHRRWQIGVGVPVGLTGVAEDSDEIGVIVQMQLEF